VAGPRPFRFGVFAEGVLTRDSLLDTARRAEDDGFATLLIRDHFIAEPFGHQLAPLATLATVASVTKRLRIGSLVFSNDYRHPVILAKEATTLDVLSEGRLELGLGAGFSRSEYAQSGLAFDPISVRAERLAESLQILKGLFKGEPFTFRGRHYEIANLQSFPASLQRPHPPLLIGGSGPRMLAVAAKEAGIVGLQTVSTSTGTAVQDPTLQSAETVRRKLDLLKRLAGARFDDIELSMVVSVILAEDRQRAAERVARDRGWDGISADEILAMPSVFIGSVDTIVAEMQARRQSFGFSYYVVHDRAMRDVAPVVARLAGR
jgi:probable F420-dependent oxidoreductase